MYILKGILYFPWRPTNICVVKISPTKILLSNVHLGRMQVSWRLDNDCSFLVLAITAGPGKIHYHRKDNYDFRAVSLFGVLFKRSVSQHSFIYPPPSTGGWIDVTLATLYSYTHLTYIHVRPYLNMCLFTYSVFPFISEQKLVHEKDGGRALLELSRRESIPPRPSEMEVALFHATIKLNQYNSIKQIEDLKKEMKTKQFLSIVNKRKCPPAPFGNFPKIRGIWWLSISWTSLRQRHAKRKVDLYNFVILGSPTRDIKGDWIKDRQIQT